ncbi:hypothetical protein APHAL10511_000947 [Amanita phalloides]|nr:hypothetical protein APHAL10511_000947 [Amanita phalloides]
MQAGTFTPFQLHRSLLYRTELFATKCYESKSTAQLYIRTVVRSSLSEREQFIRFTQFPSRNLVVKDFNLQLIDAKTCRDCRIGNICLKRRTKSQETTWRVLGQTCSHRISLFRNWKVLVCSLHVNVRVGEGCSFVHGIRHFEDPIACTLEQPSLTQAILKFASQKFQTKSDPLSQGAISDAPLPFMAWPLKTNRFLSSFVGGFVMFVRAKVAYDIGLG